MRSDCLGVGLTGIMDNEITAGLKGKDALAAMLDDLRGVAVETNAEWADRLGIPRSTAVTTVKPSGTGVATDGRRERHPPSLRETLRADRAQRQAGIR